MGNQELNIIHVINELTAVMNGYCSWVIVAILLLLLVIPCLFVAYFWLLPPSLLICTFVDQLSTTASAKLPVRSWSKSHQAWRPLPRNRLHPAVPVEWWLEKQTCDSQKDQIMHLNEWFSNMWWILLGISKANHTCIKDGWTNKPVIKRRSTNHELTIVLSLLNHLLPMVSQWTINRPTRIHHSFTICPSRLTHHFPQGLPHATARLGSTSSEPTTTFSTPGAAHGWCVVVDRAEGLTNAMEKQQFLVLDAYQFITIYVANEKHVWFITG